jgi:peroxiredoxin Q/BCP
MDIHEGAPAAAIELQTDAGETFRLSDLKGKNVVVYFYPKADTPGCTTEACDFRDHMTKFEKADTVIVGISPDATKAQAKFKTKYGLPFTLLADVDHAVADAFGVWVEKSMYGKKYMGVERSTFLIDKSGKVAKAFHKVKVAGHAEQVLEALQSL